MNHIRIITLLLLAFGALGAFAQETYSPPSLEELNARLESTQNLDAVPEAVKGQIEGYLNNAIDARASFDNWQSLQQRYQASITGAPNELAEVEEAINELAEREVDINESLTRAELEPMLLQAQSDLAEARATLEQLQSEPGRRSERRRTIPTEISTARGVLTELETNLATSPSPDEAPELRSARETALRMRQISRRAEIRAYELELQMYDARSQLLARREFRARREVDYQERVVAQLSDVIESKRALEVQEAAQETLDALGDISGYPPVVQSLFNDALSRYQELLDQRSGPDGTIQLLASVDTMKTRIDETLTDLKSRRTSVEERVLAAGSSEASGRLLRSEAESLPDVREHRRNIESRKTTIANAELAKIRARDESRELDSGSVAADALDNLTPGLDDELREEVEEKLAFVYNRQSLTLTRLYEDYDRYAAKLTELDVAERELANVIEGYSDFIAERVLFIRSGSWPNLQMAKDVVTSTKWLVRPEQWLNTVRDTWYHALTRPVLYGLSIVVVLLLVLCRKLMIRANAVAAAEASKRDCVHINWTVRSLVYAILRGAPLPASLYLFGHAMASADTTSELAVPMGESLVITSMVLAPLIIIRNLIRPEGFAQKHFGWPEDLCKKVRRPIRAYGPIACVAVFFAFTFELTRDDMYRESMGRLAFIVTMGFALAAVLPAVRGRQSTLNAVFGRLKLGEWRALRRIVRFMLIAGPIGLILASISGYHYTAIRLCVNLYLTAMLTVSATILAGVGTRWIRLTRQALHKEQLALAREKKKERVKEEKASGAEVPSELAAVQEEEVLDLNVVDEQANRLVRAGTLALVLVGTWFIWAEMVPALEVLDDIEIGQTTEMMSTDGAANGGLVGDAVGGAIDDTAGEPSSVTLLNLLTAAIIILLAIAATKNIPGLLELAVLQRLHLGAGERYAITSLVRYSLGAIGIVLAFNAVGIGWSRVQWLVAALGVGLGFGLQEIFANFVSGIILLFERPIRLGDTVTVGGINGTVTKIRIRATTITDFDRKDLVVPNKEFVTTQLINWTLSDSVLRIVVPVGVSYDADVRLAEKTLIEVADKNEYVLKDPKPRALFLGFGDSTLNFELHIFCGSMDNFLPIRHTIHMGICEAFREKGIEIAYPQRDVHFRSADIPLFDTMRPDDTNES